MKFFIILVLCLVPILASPLPHDVASPSAEISGRITNGITATSGQIPYQVALYLFLLNDKFAFCGGSLISKNWVMTAAHCTVDVKSIYVYLGVTNLNYPESQQALTNSSIVRHSGYNSGTMENDIALIKINSVTFTTNTKAISIPALSDVNLTYVGNKATASGFGITSDLPGQTITNILQYGSFVIVNKSSCESYYSLKFPTILCANTPNHVSTCGGDSGGPLVLGSIQIGIVSFGSSWGCEKSSPVGFTNINKFVDWIISKTGI